MNRAVLFFFFLAITFTASSQRLYFIYLQTETQQPFFVKIGEKVNSSTATGYLILSRLKDSVYNLTLGFAGNQVAEQKFSCTINKKDHGFLVKNFGDKGWGLVDLQNSSIQMAANDKKDVSFTNAPVNAFTDLLAKAADDSTLRQKIVLPDEKAPEVLAQLPVNKEEVKKDEIKNSSVTKIDTPKTGTASVPIVVATLKKEEIKKDTGQNTDAVVKNIPPKEEPKQTKPAADATVKNDEGKKDAKQSTDTIAKNNTVNVEPKQTKPAADATVKRDEVKKERKQNTDTVAKNILPKEVAKQTKPVDDAIAKTEEKKGVDKTVQEAPVSEESYTRTKILRKSESSTTDGFGLVYIDMQHDGKQDTIRILIPNNSNNVQLINNKTKDAVDIATDTVADKEETVIENNNSVSAPANTTVSKSISKNNCRQVATDDDFYKLRRKMAAGRSDISMMDEANKVFKTRCFTTTQIKNLGTLFLGDGGKFNFFDVAYSHVSDAGNFASLQSELKDDYFINRFKAMLR